MGALDPQTQKEAQRLIDAIYPLVAQRFYETGEWTPRLVGSSTAGVLTYSPTLTTGSFIRIGAKVTAVARITLTAVTTPAAGDLRLTGLPYAVGASGFRWGSVTAYDDFNLTAGSLELKVYPVAGQSYALFAETVDNGDRVTAIAANLTATTTLDVVLEYEGGDRLGLREAILALGPIAYWPLDEASGTTATDISGNGRNGTYSGDYTLATDAAPFVAPAFRLGGSVNVYSASLSGAFGYNVGSIIAFVRSDVIEDAPAVVTLGTPTGPRVVQIGHGNQGFGFLQQSAVRIVGGNLRSIPILPDSGWSAWGMVTITWDTGGAGTLQIYSNGALAGSDTGIVAWGAPTLNSALCFLAGADPEIQLAHVAVFDYVLDAAQIASVYDAYQNSL